MAGISLQFIVLGGGLVTSWELVLVSGVWRGWVADSFSCFFKSKLLVLRCVIFLFFKWGVLGGTVGRFFRGAFFGGVLFVYS